MTSPENSGEPIIRDKRRIDPTTGERREVSDEEATAQQMPDGGTQVPPSGASPQGESEASDAVEAARAEALDLADQLARARAETYNTEQRFNAFVKRSREQEAAAREAGRADVVEALIPVLDDLALARSHGELTGPFLAIAEKFEQTLGSRFGVERFGEQGDEFDPTLHEALMHQVDEQYTTATIAMVAQPGYRRGETVLRPARVGVVGPE